jgi:hypothetical protein
MFGQCPPLWFQRIGARHKRPETVKQDKGPRHHCRVKPMSAQGFLRMVKILREADQAPVTEVAKKRCTM